MATDRSSRNDAVLGRWQYQHTVSTLAFLALFAVMGARIVISPVVPEINAAFGISRGDIGLAITGMTMAYALAQLGSGALGDRYGERRTVLLALCLTAAGSFLLALSPSFVGFAAFAGLLGAGSGLYRTAAESLLDRVTRDSDTAISGHAAGAAAAGLLAPTAAVAVTAHVGWRGAVALGGVAAVAVAGPFWWFTEPAGPSRSATATDGGVPVTAADLRSLAATPGVLYTTAVGILGNFAFGAFLTFFPLFLIQHWGFSAGRAGAAFGVVAFCSVGGLLVVGRIAGDYLPRDTVLAGLYAAAGVGFALTLLGPGTAAVWLGSVLLGIGLSWSGLITTRFLALETDVGRGTALGFHKTAVLLVGSLGPVTVGALSEAAGWTVAYGLVVAALVAVAASLWLVRVLSLDV